MKDAAAQDLVGRVLDGRYRVVERLGAGGMGTVYRGEHVAISRPVAIKVLNPVLASSEDVVARFEREARAAGALSHPNCVPVTDFGRLEEGLLYLVMELVDGRSLESLLEDEGRLPVKRALRIARQVLRGLGHAHAAAIVHRDIKPDNVMLARREDEDGGEYARVVDFGIAQLTGDDSERLTQVGMAVGTPSYLSPEQAFGGVVDHRSDLYSTTVLLFRMLAGRAPFRGETPLAVLTAHASAPIPRVADVAPDVVVTAEVEALLQRGLAKQPEERFRDAAEYVAAIDECLGTSDTLTPPPPAAPEEVAPTASVPVTQPAAHAPTSLATPVPTPAPMATPTPTPAPMAVPATLTGATAAPQPRRRSPWLVVAVSAGLLVILISAFAACPGHEEHLERQIEVLRSGESCEERRGAVIALDRLGDRRALPELRRAVRRRRGGVLGIGGRNTNRCLIDDARRAIERLEKLPPRE